MDTVDARDMELFCGLISDSITYGLNPDCPSLDVISYLKDQISETKSFKKEDGEVDSELKNKYYAATEALISLYRYKKIKADENFEQLNEIRVLKGLNPLKMAQKREFNG